MRPQAEGVGHIRSWMGGRDPPPGPQEGVRPLTSGLQAWWGGGFGRHGTGGRLAHRGLSTRLDGIWAVGSERVHTPLGPVTQAG